MLTGGFPSQIGSNAEFDGFFVNPLWHHCVKNRANAAVKDW